MNSRVFIRNYESRNERVIFHLLFHLIILKFAGPYRNATNKNELYKGGKTLMCVYVVALVPDRTSQRNEKEENITIMLL